MTAESVFTGPTALCPHPERWSASDAWGSEVEVSGFLAALCRLLRPTRVLETGTYQGDTAEAMATVLAEHGGHLDTVECDPERAAAAQVRLAGLPATVHCCDSLALPPPVGGWGLFFFDSSIEARPDELARFHRFASLGAVWTMHDTTRRELRRALVVANAQGLVASVVNFPTPRGLSMGQWA